MWAINEGRQCARMVDRYLAGKLNGAAAAENCPRTMARRATKTRTRVPRARRSTSGRGSKPGSRSGGHGAPRLKECPPSAATTASSSAARSAARRSQAARRPEGTAKPRRAATKGAPVRPHHPRLRAGGKEVRVKRESRAGDDGYRSELLPGLRASGDAEALAQEIAFAHGRLLTLGAAPADLYGEVRALAEGDIERATWACFLIAYLSPLEGEDPFAGIRIALRRHRRWRRLRPGPTGRPRADPARSAHLPRPRARGEHAARLPPLGRARRGPGAAWAFEGDPTWSPQRRFERGFERLALPGFGRMGRYDLLVTLGRLGLYELRADSLHLTSASEAHSRRSHHIGRQAGVRDRRSAAARAPRPRARRGDLGAD